MDDGACMSGEGAISELAGFIDSVWRSTGIGWSRDVARQYIALAINDSIAAALNTRFPPPFPADERKPVERTVGYKNVHDAWEALAFDRETMPLATMKEAIRVARFSLEAALHEMDAAITSSCPTCNETLASWNVRKRLTGRNWFPCPDLFHADCESGRVRIPGGVDRAPQNPTGSGESGVAPRLGQPTPPQPWTRESLAEAIDTRWKAIAGPQGSPLSKWSEAAADIALSRGLGKVETWTQLASDLRDDDKAVTPAGSSVDYLRGHRAGRWDAANAVDAARKA